MNLVLLFGDSVYENSFMFNAVQGNIYTFEVIIGYAEISVNSRSIKEWNSESDDVEVLDKTTEIAQGTAGNPFLINSVAELGYIGDGEYHDSVEPWDPSAHYKLTGDIICDETTAITPAISASNPFFGELDGNDCIIKNISITTTSGDYTGLIPYVSANAKIHDLNLEGCVISAASGYVGAIAGHNEGTITNCTVSGTITNSASVSTGCATGGIVGHNESIVDGCVCSATVTGNWKVGGIVGYLNEGFVVNCGNKGAVTNDMTTSASSLQQQSAGGIVGSGDSKTYILNCYNQGDINGGNAYNVGGVAGFTNGSIISVCYNTGALSGLDYIGGIVGRVYATSNVSDCYYLEGSASCGIGIQSGSVNYSTAYVVEDEVGRTEALTDAQMRCADTHYVEDNYYLDEMLSSAAIKANSTYTSITINDWTNTQGDYPYVSTEPVTDPS